MAGFSGRWVVFLLDLLLQNRARAALRYALWLLVVVKLVLPPSLALPTGISYWLPVKEMDVPHLAQPPVMTLVASMEPKISSGSEPASSPSQPFTVGRDGMLLIAWLWGCVGLVGAVISRSRRLAQLVKSAAPAATEFQLLATAISSTVGGLFDPMRVWIDMELIRTKYAEAGRTNTEVKFSWSEVDLESNSSVAFVIIEAQ